MKINKTLSILIALAACVGINTAWAQKPHVYINPGHGGHSSDDRNVVVPGYASGDTAGYWESNSNLKKGFALQEVLKKSGYTTSISRITNTEDDDLALSTIVALCNNSGADVFFSLHSNATGQGEGYRINFPLGLYRGYTGQPVVEHSDELAAILQPFLYANKSTVWTSNYAIYGDWTFYPSWGTQGLGVLRGNNAVSMLQEGSFHDYIPEALRLLNADYCWVEGYNVARAANAYFGIENPLGTGVLTGRILDDRILRSGTYVMHGADAREPVCGATVRLLDASGNEIDRCVTDQDRNGIYLFKYVTPGTYTVEVTEEEHFSQSQTVEVVFDEPTYLNFDLKRVRNTPPQVVSYSPVWNEGDDPLLCNVPIELNFNWDMDVASTEAAFTITPAVEGTFTWEDTNYRLIFTPEDAYATDTEYTVTIKGSAQHGGGTEMGEDFSFKFATTSRNHLNALIMWPSENAPVHYQSATMELRTDSLLRSLNLYTLFHVYDKDGKEVSINKRSIKTNKTGDPYGYIRIPISGSLNVGETYTLSVDRSVCDTAGIHLPAALNYPFTAVDAGATKSGDVYNVEESDYDYLEGNYNEATLATSTTRLFGSKSVQVKYDFNGIDNPSVRFCPTQVFVMQEDTIGIHVNGDLSCNNLVGVFRIEYPTGGEYEQKGPNVIEIPFGKLDFAGWRYMTTTITGLDKAYYLEDLKIVGDKDNVIGETGTVLIDDIVKKSRDYSAIDDVQLAGVAVGPSPASDYLVARADHYIQGVELLDMQGKLVTRNGANYINVSDIPDGLYIMRVYVNNLTSTHKVIVKH